MTRLIRGVSSIVVLFVVTAALLAASAPSRATLHKPTYAAGDHWVYVLDASLSTFPGFNASQGTFQFGLIGFVYVNVIGPVNVLAGNASIPAIRVDSRATGYLNGTVPGPGGLGSAQLTGTFATSSTEFWEDQSYLSIQSHGTSTYDADVTFIVTTKLVADLRVDATTSVTAIPPFDLDVGQNATANLTSHVELNSTFSAFGRTMSSQNETNLSSTWHRDVLSLENVTVDAGTFSAYKLNQTLAGFPGIPAGLSGGGNETAYFSNDVGFYVKRVAYENGTRAGEMRLRSYSYGAGPPSGLSAVQLLLIAAVPAAIILLLIVLLWRRRKARIQGGTSPGTPPTAEGHEKGGNEGAR